MHDSLRDVRNVFVKIFDKWRIIICYIVVFTLALSSIIRADYDYIDDAGRVIGGYRDGEFSRYLMDFLSQFIHADNFLSDISPITQIIAVSFGAVSCVSIIVCMNPDSKKINFWQFISAIPVVISPYFIQCLSYKFDSPYMAISVMTSIVPVLFIECKWWIYMIMSVACILMMLTSYQASSGIYPILVMFVLANRWNAGARLSKTVKIAMESAACYILTLLFYRKILMKSYNSYVSTDTTKISEILLNYKKYYVCFFHDFKMWWLILIGIITLIGMINFVATSKQKKYIAALVQLFVVLLSIPVCLGAYPLLEGASQTPRYMYGMCILIALLFIQACQFKKYFIPGTLSLGVVWAFIALTLIYGNALAEQKRFTEYRINAAIDDIQELINETNKSDEKYIVQLSGNIGKSPVLKGTMQNTPMLNRLLPSATFAGRESGYWGKYSFYRFYGATNFLEDSSVDLTTLSLPLLYNCSYHTIYGEKNYILVELK